MLNAEDRSHGASGLRRVSYRRSAVFALVVVSFSIQHSAFSIDKPPGAFVWRLPRGLPIPRVPADNPVTQVKVDLGRTLFYDTRLSGNGRYACASCHQQARAFTDGRAHAVGSTGGLHRRSTMSLANVAYNVTYGWADPALRTLEQQMAVPMFNEHPVEMGINHHEREILARLERDRTLVQAFRDAFPADPDPVTLKSVVKAIATFERTLLSADSPFDRYLYRDDRRAMSAAALRGKDLFFSDRLRCSECHASFNLSGPVTFERASPVPPLFHNTALYDTDGRGAYPRADRGLIEATARPADMGRFRAPTLRNVAVTGPYMHDGSVPTLRAAVAHYASGGVASPLRSDRIKGFRLTPDQTGDLIAFLESLTDRGFLTNPAFARPPALPRAR